MAAQNAQTCSWSPHIFFFSLTAIASGGVDSNLMVRRELYWEGLIVTGEEAMGLDGAPHLPAAQDAQHLRHLRDFKAINIELPVREREREKERKRALISKQRNGN